MCGRQSPCDGIDATSKVEEHGEGRSNEVCSQTHEEKQEMIIYL